MPLIDYIDGPNRRIYLHADTAGGGDLHPVDIYKEMRTLRRLDESLRKYDVFLTAKGNEPKGGGKFTERYVICNLGTRIVPYDVNHTITVTGTLITDDAQEGVDCFDRTLLSMATCVDINYIPTQVEVQIVDLTPLEAASFNGRISIDIDNGVAGTDFPIGTEGMPSNNLDDTLAISAFRGFKTLYLASNLTLDRDMLEYTFEGSTSHLANTLDFAGYDIGVSKVDNLTLVGDMHGTAQFEDCFFNGVTGLSGVAKRCGFGIVNNQIHDNQDFIAHMCFSEVAGSATPSVIIGVASTFQFRGWIGGMNLVDVADGNVGSFDMLSGHFKLDASCTGGNISFRGMGKWTRNDSGAVNVDAHGFISDPDGKLRRQMNMYMDEDGILRETE